MHHEQCLTIWSSPWDGPVRRIEASVVHVQITFELDEYFVAAGDIAKHWDPPTVRFHMVLVDINDLLSEKIQKNSTKLKLELSSKIQEISKILKHQERKWVNTEKADFWQVQEHLKL